MHELSTPATQPGPIQLNWEGANPVVLPDDAKRLAQGDAWPSMPYPQNLAAERFWRQFRDEFLTALHAWCQQHAERVVACYVPFAQEHIKVFVVSRSATYDFSLSDELADLEMNLFDKQWPSEINQIPAGPRSLLENFFDPAASIQVYGNGG